ncbi:MAG: hypothetical protein V4714_15745 [Bacteroidota bacterium]
MKAKGKNAITTSFTVFLLLWCASLSMAQELADTLQNPRIFFPYPMGERQWRTSIGLVFTTTPQDITEEVRVRVPAIDLHTLRNLNSHFYLDGQLKSQVIQNHLSIGIRWAHPITPRLSFSVGDDIGAWFGFLKLESFNSRGYGWLNYPNISLGYRLKNDLLLTFKTEAIFNLHSSSYVGDNRISYNNNRLNGVGFTWVLEQPFYNKTHFTLGVRALYTDFNWQFWSLHATFDRKIFYPQLIFGFIL